MKKFLFLLTIAFAAMSMSAAPVDQATAQKKAKDYLAQAYAGKIMSPNALNPVLVKTEMCNGKSTPAFYVYNTSTTFVVVAADDRAETILMVGDKPLQDVENLPLGLQDMFTVYKGEITYLAEHPDLKVVANVKNNSLNAVTYGPLLSCNWDTSATPAAPQPRLPWCSIIGNIPPTPHPHCPAMHQRLMLVIGTQSVIPTRQCLRLPSIGTTCSTPTLAPTPMHRVLPLPR